MASIYKRPGSQFWWIKFHDPNRPRLDARGKPIPRRESTGYRIGTGEQKRKAQELEAEYTLRERQSNQAHPNEAWKNWVTPFLDLRYQNSPNTCSRAKTAWRTIKMFLAEQQLALPRQLTREHCFQYLTWRNKPNKSQAKYRACHNTALLELKFLRVIMREAVLRKYCVGNPCSELGIKKSPPREKPELTPEIVARIRAAIQATPEPLHTALHHSFEISYHHGVRLSATYLNPMEDVWFDSGLWKIRFTQKGNRTSTKILHPHLVPLFEKLRANKCTETYPKPPRREWLSAEWGRFLRRHKIRDALPGVSFHSTRVTVATTLARKGVDQRIAMEYVDHASTTVHRSYVRLKPQDFSQPCHDAIQ
jgi:integrase